jgi:hypothetical protein
VSGPLADQEGGGCMQRYEPKLKEFFDKIIEERDRMFESAS